MQVEGSLLKVRQNSHSYCTLQNVSAEENWAVLFVLFCHPDVDEGSIVSKRT